MAANLRVCKYGLTCRHTDDAEHTSVFTHLRLNCRFGNSCRRIGEEEHLEQYSHDQAPARTQRSGDTAHGHGNTHRRAPRNQQVVIENGKRVCNWFLRGGCTNTDADHLSNFAHSCSMMAMVSVPHGTCREYFLRNCDLDDCKFKHNVTKEEYVRGAFSSAPRSSA